MLPLCLLYELDRLQAPLYMVIEEPPEDLLQLPPYRFSHLHAARHLERRLQDMLDEPDRARHYGARTGIPAGTLTANDPAVHIAEPGARSRIRTARCAPAHARHKAHKE